MCAIKAQIGLCKWQCVLLMKQHVSHYRSHQHSRFPPKLLLKITSCSLGTVNITNKERKQNVSFCFTSSPAFGVRVLDFGYSNSCVVMPHRCFNLHWPNGIWCKTPFPMHICHLCISFGEMSVKVVGPFFNQVVYFPTVEF